MTEPRFDPEHDARYQRGYEPGNLADPAASDIPAILSPAADSPPTNFVGPTDVGSVPTPDADEPLDQFEPGNPFIVALWIIGPVLIIGGLILQARTILSTYFSSGFAGSSSTEVPLEMVMQQLIWTLAPAMTATGLATVVGLLFFHALRWRSRSTRR
ncbi:hypothetical protein [Cryobacterium ruanii]|uniref:Uncharacterized protein n=1 Tax=Cryobacterium ruanii TaxID=1259197 RepID=A0A4R9ALG9_9MICO|nr:hypothetical protein [Cryobacterium ruanii]TFD64156.1 hypothetical protein E3T47_11635 [Cryobacterium ruanii]